MAYSRIIQRSFTSRTWTKARSPIDTSSPGASRTGKSAPANPRPRAPLVKNGKPKSAPKGLLAAFKPLAVDPKLLLTKLTVGKSRHEYQADETVFSQGDIANEVFFIESGKIKLTVVSKSGKEAVIAHLTESSFFGEGCLAGQLVRMATASAMQKTGIIRIDKQAMVGLLQREAEFAEQFLMHMLSRNIRMEADLIDHLFNSSEKRLARLLLLMANFGQESKPIPLIAKISQEALAEMIGTTRSRVSFFLNRFRELGFIDYNAGGMNVNSSLVSVVLHD
jgi:CRP/FNR family transcriptional regulator, cyclic AMP receptor protein